jgi:hypothetical protein
MITYLEVTDENLEDLRELGLDCNEGDELECEVAFDVNRADPDVGIMSDDVQVTSVTCNGFDVERFFDEDDLHEQAMDDREATMEDMADQAAEWKRDAMRGL